MKKIDMLKDIKEKVKEDEKILWSSKPSLFAGVFLANFAHPLFSYAIFLMVLGCMIMHGLIRVDLYFMNTLLNIFFIIGCIMMAWYSIFCGINQAKYMNSGYLITDKKLYFSTGIKEKIIKSISFDDLLKIETKQSFINLISSTKDIILTFRRETVKLSYISEYQKVVDIIKAISKNKNDNR